MDPLAGEYAAWSTYNYVLGNPVMFVDPDGRSVEEIWPPFSDPISTLKAFRKIGTTLGEAALATFGALTQVGDYHVANNARELGNEEYANELEKGATDAVAILALEAAGGKGISKIVSSSKGLLKASDNIASKSLTPVPLRARHHTNKQGADGIMRDGAINPSRPAQGNPVGVDVEVQPFGNPRTASENANAFGAGRYVEFDVKPGEVTLTPNVHASRNFGRIITDKPLTLNYRNPKVKRVWNAKK